jgi:hypothetical protein
MSALPFTNKIANTFDLDKLEPLTGNVRFVTLNCRNGTRLGYFSITMHNILTRPHNVDGNFRIVSIVRKSTSKPHSTGFTSGQQNASQDSWQEAAKRKNLLFLESSQFRKIFLETPNFLSSI